MGTVASEDFETGTAAGLAGGTTMIIDFVIPNPQQNIMEAYKQWREWAEKSVADYSFHVAITWWDDSVHKDMGHARPRARHQQLQALHGLQGRHHGDDEILVNSFSKAIELGAIVTVSRRKRRARLSPAAENLRDGHHRSRRATRCRGRPKSRAKPRIARSRIAEVLGVPIYLVHNSCIQSLESITRARNEGSARVSAKCSQDTCSSTIRFTAIRISMSPQRT